MAVEKRELAAAVTKGVLGAIPVLGPLVAEVVGTFIPNRRLERIEGFLKILETEVRDLSHERLRSRFEEPGFVDVFEEGVHQAARALSNERLGYLAALVAAGLAEDDVKALETKHLLGLLGELNDVEVIILRSHAVHPQRDEEFWKRHDSILRPRPVHTGSTREELDQAAVYRSYRDHLERLGLFRATYRVPRKGETPEFDEQTGTLKGRSAQITPLGRLLLRRIGLLSSE